MNHLRAIVAASAWLLASVAHATDFPIFNTGVDASGNPLPLGAADPHWTVVSGPTITTPQAAIVLTAQRDPLDTYYATTDSRWEWVTASGVAGVRSPYTFELKFDLTGFDPSTFSIHGSWGVDNTATVLLNGKAPIGTGALSLLNASNFVSPTPFTITGGFQPGINTLDMNVTDLGFVGGLDVTALSAEGTPLPAVPEASGSLMLACGLALIATLRRRVASKGQGSQARRRYGVS